MAENKMDRDSCRLLVETLYGPNEPEEMYLPSDNLQRAINQLPAHSREVILMKFGIETGKPITLRKVGERFERTPERIRQIEARALRILRHPSIYQIISGKQGPITDDEPVGRLQLSYRALNCLKGAGIETIGQLKQTYSIRLLKIRHLGCGTYTDICIALRKHGMSPPDGFRRDVMGKYLSWFIQEGGE